MSKCLRITPERYAEILADQRPTAANPALSDGPGTSGAVVSRPPLKLKPSVEPESSVLANVLKALLLHPKVREAWRVNTGAHVVPESDSGPRRYIKFGFRGCPDIHGWMRDGRALYVECKRAGENPTEDQAAFLTKAKADGCVAFVARGIDDVLRELDGGGHDEQGGVVGAPAGAVRGE